MSSKSYIGDAVYADLSEFGEIVLTTENGIRATNTIILEPKVWYALMDWVAHLPRSQNPDVGTPKEVPDAT